MSYFQIFPIGHEFTESTKTFALAVCLCFLEGRNHMSYCWGILVYECNYVPDRNQWNKRKSVEWCKKKEKHWSQPGVCQEVGDTTWPQGQLPHENLCQRDLPPWKLQWDNGAHNWKHKLSCYTLVKLAKEHFVLVLFQHYVILIALYFAGT